MILTGKAKEDFILWLNNLPVAPYEVMLDYIPKCYLNALIIDFFFIKDLHITEVLDGELNLKYVLTPISENCFLQEQIISENNFSLDISLCKIEAIKKANEIYNEATRK